MSDDISRSATPQRSVVRHWWHLGVVLAVLAASWTFVVGRWLPTWLRPKLEQAASASLGVPVTLGALTLHPWTLKAQASDLRIGAAGGEILQVAKAELQLSSETLWRFAPVIRRVTIDQPQLWIERQQAKRFNFTPLLERLQSAPASKDQSPTRFAVFNIRINQGSVRYTDRVLREEHRIDRLHLGIPFISTLSSDIDVDVQPQLEARIDGSPLRVVARTLPFSAARRSEVELNWSAIDAAKLAAAVRPLLQPGLDLDVGSGRIDTRLMIGFEARKPPAVPLLTVNGGLVFSQLNATWPAQGLSWHWATLRLNGIDTQPLERHVKLGDVEIDGLRVDLTPHVVSTPPGPDAKAKAVTHALSQSTAANHMPQDWRWSVNQLRVAADAVHLAPTAAVWPTLGPVRLEVRGLSSIADAPAAQAQLDVADGVGGKAVVQGAIRVAPPSAKLHIQIQDWQLSPWLTASAPALALPVAVHQGKLSVDTAVVADTASLSIVHGQARLAEFKSSAIQPASTDHLNVDSITAQEVSAKALLPHDGSAAALQTLVLASLTVENLDAHATRDAQGGWLGGGTRPAASAHAETKTPAKAPLPAIHIDDIRCQGCKLEVDDQSVQPTAHFALAQTQASIHGVSNDWSHTMQAQLDAKAQGTGTVQFNGDVRVEPLLVRGKLAINGLDLRAAQSYIEPYVNIKVDTARADLNGAMALEAERRAGLRASFRGRAGLNTVHVLDSVTRNDLLRWRTLSFNGLDVDWAAHALKANLGEVALNDFYGRVIINPQGQLNLSQIAHRSKGAAAQSLTNADATPAAPAAEASAPPALAPAEPGLASAPLAQGAPEALPASAPSVANAMAVGSTTSPTDLRWQGITLSKGRVDFTDNFVQPHYSAHLTRLHGHISKVASRRPEPATVQVSAALDDSAPVEISGQLHPLGPKLYTDISGSATGIELTRLSTYAARYAGYAVEKGTLSVKVHYKVDQGKLQAENQIFLDQLTFGEKVNSPDATKLPVLLAVALLKDSRGHIDVNLPISGSLDDPHFSIGGIIWRVIINLLTKAIIAPFSLLSGGGSQELSYVPFEPGSAELSPAVKQTLDSLATKLIDRPALKLEATGRADPTADVEGLRKRYVDRLMRTAKAKATDQSPSDVKIGEQEKITWLTAAYKAADIKKPRNFIGLAKTLPPDQMLALLKAAAPTDADALHHLADRRGDAVKAYLITKLPPERVMLNASKVAPAPEDHSQGPGSQVQFALH